MSEEITLEQAHRLVEQADRVLVEGWLAAVDTSRLRGKPDARWLHVSWTELQDEDVEDLDTRFLEGCNTLVEHECGSIYPVNEHGVRMKLTLLRRMDIEQELKNGK